jgi:hypothetical protein
VLRYSYNKKRLGVSMYYLVSSDEFCDVLKE